MTAKELEGIRGSVGRLGVKLGDEIEDEMTTAERLETILSRLGEMTFEASQAGREVDQMRGLLKVLEKRLRAVETGEAEADNP